MIERSLAEKMKSLLIHDRRDVGSIVVYGIFVSFFSLITPIAVQTFVNTIGFGLLMQPIFILTLIVFSILSFSSILSILQIYVTEILQQRIFARAAIELAGRIPRFQVDLFYNNQQQKQVSHFFEIITIQKTITTLVLDGVSVALQIFFGMVLLAFYHPFLFVLDVLIIVFILLVFFGLAKKAIETSNYESKSKYLVFGWLDELARSLSVFRSKGSRELALSRADDLTANYIRARKKHFSILLKQIIAASMLQVLVSALLLGIGGWLVVHQQLTLGQLVASELVLTSVVAGIGKFGKYLENYYDLAASVDKLDSLLNLPIERSNGELIHSKQAPLVKADRLSYRTLSKKVLLSSLSFEIHQNSVTAVVGPNGSGKTLLTRMLYGFVPPQSGNLEIKGLDQKYWTLDEIRSEISLVGSPEFFTGTLLDNIRVAQTDIDLFIIQKALKSLGLFESIEALPLGLNTLVGAEGVPLSSGEAQKLMIVRALVQKPSLVILDEGLDHLDPESSKQIIQYLVERKKDFSSLITTRRQDLAQYCDQIIQLKESKLAGQPK